MSLGIPLEATSDENKIVERVAYVFAHKGRRIVGIKLIFSVGTLADKFRFFPCTTRVSTCIRLVYPADKQTYKQTYTNKLPYSINIERFNGG